MHVDREKLAGIADTIDSEAQTWREGFAVWTGKQYVWTGDKNDEFARIRCANLEKASTYIRKLIRVETLGPSPRVEAAIAAE